MNLCIGGMKVFTGNANEELGQKICKELGIPLGTCDVSNFSDGEINVNIDETVRGIDVFIVQSTCSPVVNLNRCCKKGISR